MVLSEGVGKKGAHKAGSDLPQEGGCHGLSPDGVFPQDGNICFFIFFFSRFSGFYFFSSGFLVFIQALLYPHWVLENCHSFRSLHI